MAKKISASGADDEPDDLIPFSDDEFLQMSDAQVAELFRQAVLDVTRSLARASFLYLELQRRGCPLEQLNRLQIVQAVRLVATGVLAKEAFAAFYSDGKSRLLRSIALLPMEQQLELAASGQIERCEIAGNETTHRLVPINTLRASDIDLIFDAEERRIRSKNEQAAIVGRRNLIETMERRTAHISHDERTGIINAKNATADELRGYMKKHGI